MEAGHEVTVVPRSGNIPDGALAVVGGAVDPGVARIAVEGADAVVITVGVPRVWSMRVPLLPGRLLRL